MAAKSLPPKEGLLALLYFVHTDKTVRDLFRKGDTFDKLLDDFKITDPATRALILQVGLIDPATYKDATPNRRPFPDKQVYLQLLEKLYDQLGDQDVFEFGW